LRIGVLGGTFDPPHVGHLIAAVDAYERLELDTLIFIPTANQPLKQDKPAIAPAEDRLQMVRLLVANDARFEVSETEIERGGLSYTVDTLEALTKERPGDELVLIVGLDAMKSFDQWKDWKRIRLMAGLAVLTRDAAPQTSAEVGTATIVGTRRIDVSSSEIRERLRQGKSVRGFVTESVEAYIAERNLYRQG
jgi:nicotinate-nucleotide adenylyltransferase